MSNQALEIQILASLVAILFPSLIYALARGAAWNRRASGHKASFRLLEERCRAIVFALESEWPELHNLRGNDLIRAIEEKILPLRQSRSGTFLSSHTTKPQTGPKEYECKCRECGTVFNARHKDVNLCIDCEPF